jgi:hypothetical protein
MERDRRQGRPDGVSSNQPKPEQRELDKPKQESELSKLFDEKRLFAAWAPKGRDTESYPIEAMRQIQDEINERIRRQHTIAEHWPEDLIQGKRMKAIDNIFITKMYSLLRSVDRVQKAYEIIAYPSLKNQELKKSIKRELEEADEGGPGEVELNEEELEVIRKMTTIRRLPFDSEKRVYEYTEVTDFTWGLFRRRVYR